LDHFVLRQIQPGAYCRYVDDFLLFHGDRDFCTRRAWAGGFFPFAGT